MLKQSVKAAILLLEVFTSRNPRSASWASKSTLSWCGASKAKQLRTSATTTRFSSPKTLLMTPIFRTQLPSFLTRSKSKRKIRSTRRRSWSNNRSRAVVKKVSRNRRFKQGSRGSIKSMAQATKLSVPRRDQKFSFRQSRIAAQLRVRPITLGSGKINSLRGQMVRKAQLMLKLTKLQQIQDRRRWRPVSSSSRFRWWPITFTNSRIRINSKALSKILQLSSLRSRRRCKIRGNRFAVR